MCSFTEEAIEEAKDFWQITRFCSKKGFSGWFPSESTARWQTGNIFPHPVFFRLTVSHCRLSTTLNRWYLLIWPFSYDLSVWILEWMLFLCLLSIQLLWAPPHMFTHDFWVWIWSFFQDSIETSTMFEIYWSVIEELLVFVVSVSSLITRRWGGRYVYFPV